MAPNNPFRMTRTRLTHSVLLLLLTVQLQAQPFAIGHTTLTFNDPARNNRPVETEIYYPAAVAGNDVPVSSAVSTPFPVLAFGHGFVMGWESYQNIWNALVPQGYILALPKTESSFSPSHDEFGKDLALVISKMTELGNTSTSIFFNRVHAMNAVMGHSMGGGAAFLAASANPSIKALLVLAPANTTPSAIDAATTIQIPSLIVSGANDCITTPTAHQLPMYNNLASTCKTYISITGGSHCQMANSNFNCSFGESTCTPAPTINRTTQHAILNNYMIPWLNAQLKNDCNAGAVFNSLLTASAGISHQENCTLCPTMAAETITSESNLSIFPNPFENTLTLHNPSGEKLLFVLSDMTGKKIIQKEWLTTEEIITENIPSGTYLYQIKKDKKILKKGKLVKK